MNQSSDPDELFSKSPNVLKFNETATPITSLIEASDPVKVVKTKKSVPSNITCHCADCLNPEIPVGSRPIRADIRKFDFKSFIAEEKTLGGYFDVILMDPPWQLAGQAPSRGVSLLYDQLHDKLIEDMEVEVLQRDGLVFIWVINNKFVRALDMMEKWGYKYLMDIAWVKRTVNRKLAKCHGYYLQHAKETCLVGIKGQIDSNILTRLVGSDVIYSERRGQSQKPTEIYEMIEEIFGENGRFLEIFGRRHNLRSKWTTIDCSKHYRPLQMPHSATETMPSTCLIVIDGWGLSGHSSPDSDAILNAKTPVITELTKTCPSRALAAHGLAVGLPEGLMGNSEVGHLNLGAGRVVYQDIVRIDEEIESGRMESENPVLSSIFNYCLTGNKRIHFIGLVSDGGVHSHLRHLKSLLRITKKHLESHNVSAFVHAITDGRDTAPRSAKSFLCDDLIPFLEGENINFAKIGSVCGRYFAMDRDKRAERTQLAYDAITKEGSCEAIVLENLSKIIDGKYEKDETDEFFKPFLIEKEALIQKDDCIVFFNFRSDRMRQICQKFLETEITRNICTMTQYNQEFPFPVLSPPQQMTNVLAEWLAIQGLKQCHVAETEKYAHVTFFFNGGREEAFEGEERVLISSPKVATYDLKPEMSSKQVAEAMASAILSNRFAFVMGNLAPPDMVGHTGKFEETVKAVEATDEAVGIIYEACKKMGVTLFITADHGNAEKMCSEDGHPHTAHTCAPVPFICSDKNIKFQLENEAALCDVAPTLLAYMKIEKPAEMTGKSLILN